MFQATIVSILSFTKALMISPSALRLCDDGCCGRLPRARPTGDLTAQGGLGDGTTCGSHLPILKEHSGNSMWPLGQHIDPDENAGGDSKKVPQTAPTEPRMHS